MAKILICDDEPEILELIKRQLEPAGHECVTAEHGQKGFQKILTQDIKMIITDVIMPSWDGYDLAGSLDLINKDQKILVLTGCADEELVRKIRKLPNVINILSKPWDRKQLLEIVESNC